jgi:serpin B
MAQSGSFDYFETPELQAVRLSFGAGEQSMLIMLPAKTSSLREFEAQLTPEHWTQWEQRYAEHPGTVELPRFELTLSQRLNDALAALGITRIFRRDAGPLAAMFSGAPQSAARRLYIGSVVQATYWKVDEEGAEAAAVTSIGVRTAAARRPPKPFRMSVDRPFFCAIEDRRSRALLFLGAIYDPAPL